MGDPRARAEKLFEQLRTGKTIFFKAGDAWDIMGPADTIRDGATVTVTKADGTTTDVIVTEIMADSVTRGIAYRTARFRKIGKPPTAAPPADGPVRDRPTRPVYDVVQRSAVEIGAMLGATTSTGGFCHWCGLELDRKGECGECG